MHEKRRKKAEKRLPVPIDPDSDTLLVNLQGQYQVKYNQKIHKADMAGIVLNKTIKGFVL